MKPVRRPLPRAHWREVNARLDAEADCVEIYRNVALREFPWDVNQALSLALFRTFAVPSIGRLLDATGQFTTACQQRYDDTGLLLEAPLVHGFDSPEGRAGVRRVNQMHALYDISQDDLRYVLATFVVVPKRWLDDYGWRVLTEHELDASVHYYRALGRRMGIREVPTTYAGFAALMDAYEAEHFGWDAGGRRVADATLELMVSFFPRLAAPAVRRFSLALLDGPLVEAFRYAAPAPAERRLAAAALTARARLLRHLPPRREIRQAAETPRFRTVEAAPDLAGLRRLGTSAPGCPVGPGLARERPGAARTG